MKKIIVLGGGFAGVSAAQHLDEDANAEVLYRPIGDLAGLGHRQAVAQIKV